MNPSWRGLLAAALLVWGHSVAALESSAAEVVPPATGAEVLLFETDHLAGLGLPIRLQYRLSTISPATITSTFPTWRTRVAIRCCSISWSTTCARCSA